MVLGKSVVIFTLYACQQFCMTHFRMFLWNNFSHLIIWAAPFAIAASMQVDTNARFKLGLNASINHYDKDNDVTIMPRAFYDNRFYIEGSEAGYYPTKTQKTNGDWPQATISRSFWSRRCEHSGVKRLDERKNGLLWWAPAICALPRMVALKRKWNLMRWAAVRY